MTPYELARLTVDWLKSQPPGARIPVLEVSVALSHPGEPGDTVEAFVDEANRQHLVIAAIRADSHTFGEVKSRRGWTGTHLNGVPVALKSSLDERIEIDF